MAEETITVPVVQDPAIEPAATETPQTTQVAPEPQPTTPASVEGGGKEPQVPEATRKRPSDYYQERKRFRELSDEVASLRKWKEEQALLRDKDKPAAPDVPDFDPQHFSPEHKRILQAREQALRQALIEEARGLVKQELTTWQESAKAQEVERKHQEALEKLFPKTSSDSKETLQERIDANPDRAERIREILAESGLNELSKINPDKAAQYVLMELGESTKANPTILKKELMGAAPTGNPSMGTKRGVSSRIFCLKREN